VSFVPTTVIAAAIFPVARKGWVVVIAGTAQIRATVWYCRCNAIVAFLRAQIFMLPTRVNTSCVQLSCAYRGSSNPSLCCAGPMKLPLLAPPHPPILLAKPELANTVPQPTGGHLLFRLGPRPNAQWSASSPISSLIDELDRRRRRYHSAILTLN
jgi:hypothetical protein